MAMIDSGAQSNFISTNLVNKLRLPWKMKNEPYRLRTVEGELVAYGQGTVTQETAQLPIDIGGKRHIFGLDITKISQHEIILGIPWLRASNPRVNWRTGQLQWDTPGSTSVTEKRSRRDSCGFSSFSAALMSQGPWSPTLAVSICLVVPTKRSKSFLLPPCLCHLLQL
jgi:hypothetical protein